jgi:site-specific DNA-methyltransferase (adenine-specific)
MNWEEKFINRIVQGNSAKLLKEIPANQIDLIITSPPYFRQREYGNLPDEIGNEETIEEYVQNVMKVFNECVRIAKSTGSIVFNIGDAYDDGNLLLVPFRFAIEAQKNKDVKLINSVTWVKRNPTPRQYKRRLVSSTEPFFHFVKSDDYYYDVDRWLEENNKKIKTVRRENKIGHGYFSLIEKSNLTEEQKEKARKDLTETIERIKRGEIESFRMKIRGMHAPAFGGQEGGRQIQLEKQGYTIIEIHGAAIKKDVIISAVETIKGRIHPAIYPQAIVEQFIKLTTKPDSIVLDPFVGSGTTCVAAKKLGRRYIGIDVNPDYCMYAEKRLKELPMKMDVFL